MGPDELDENEECHIWLEWLDDVYQDLVSLQANRQIWHGYMEIVRANPTIQTPGTFHNWVANSYGKTQAVGVRRQGDTSSDVRTFARLLKRIAARPQILSRQRYIAIQGPGVEVEAQGWFDDLVGPGRDHVDPADVEADLSELTTRLNPVRLYVNKRVAHHVDKEFKDFPTYGDIHECLDLLWKLYRKYHLLLTGATMDDTVLLPAWDVIFLRRWSWRPPVSAENRQERAMSLVAKMSPETRTDLRDLLITHDRVPSAVTASLFEREETREFAEAVLTIDGDEVLRQAIVELLQMWGTTSRR